MNCFVIIVFWLESVVYKSNFKFVFPFNYKDQVCVAFVIQGETSCLLNLDRDIGLWCETILCSFHETWTSSGNGLCSEDS
jgi:hypothetical protein